ncbi:MAG: PTS sugar transporter subunit IIC [Actinomycetaceae bacterium]|nr:PTS sugar transporter subunit IIC [Actinomycetaceae bacterium]
MAPTAHTHPAKPTVKGSGMTILNGLAIGVVVALIPGALLGELLKAIIPTFPSLQSLYNVTLLCNSTMGAVVGIMIGILHKFTPIQTASLGLAVMIGGGAFQGLVPEGKGLILAGTGDIINMGLVATIGVFLIVALGDKFKAYTILVIPLLLVAVAGGIGILTLPYVKMITKAVGIGVAQLTGLQPLLMATLLAIVFAALIVSPITTVGIALAISLAGIGSGAANLGITACGFGFAIAGWKVNSHGTSLAHFIGSPKISMANVLAKPKILLPILCAAAVSGAAGSVLGIEGTPMSAGFGISGLIGPLNHLNLVAGGWNATNLLITGLAFIVIPVASAFVFNWLFQNVLGFVKPEDYYVDVQ